MRSCLVASLGLSCALLLAPLHAHAATRDVGGVPYQETVQLGGETLKLNGAGVRHKAVFKVYTAGLYTAAKAGTTEDVLAQPGPKRIAITMLREIDANELGKLFTRGMEENSPRNEMGQLVPGLLRMGQIFAEQKLLKAGDTFYVDWVPGKGAQVVVRDVPQGEPIREPVFYKALLRIWLGPVPADHQLKDALLGKSS